MTDQSIPEPTEAPPWRTSDGPRPRVTAWPPGQRPALWVHAAGKWRYAVVRQRQDYPDGRVAYRVDLQLPGPNGWDVGCSRAYWWGQPGIRLAHGPGERRRAGGAKLLDSR